MARVTTQFDRQQFERFYTEAFGSHILTAMLVGMGAILATAALDWLFQPQQADHIWQARAFTLAAMGLLTLLSSLRGFARAQQFIITVFTLVGCVAVLEFARRSVPPYHHYYNNAVVLIVMFCFVLTRILFRWGLLCAALLFALCNIYWLLVAPDPRDLLIIKNFVLGVTCVFSLMAAWTLESATRRNYQDQLTLEFERDELIALRHEQAREAWLDQQLDHYQRQISGDHDEQALMTITLRFLSRNSKVGFGAAYGHRDGALVPMASYALPGTRTGASHSRLLPGEGLAGQAALQTDLMAVNALPPGYTRITSGIGDMTPRQLLLCPIHFEQRNLGVIELALLHPACDTERRLLGEIGERLGQALVVAQAHGDSARDTLATPQAASS